MQESSQSAVATVNVFRPEFGVTTKNIWANYGVKVNLNEWGLNRDSITTVWKHDDTLASSVTMYDSAPPEITDHALVLTQDGTSDGTFDGTAIYTTAEQDAAFNVSGLSYKINGKDYEGTPAVTKPVDGQSSDILLRINRFDLDVTKQVVGNDSGYYTQSFRFELFENEGGRIAEFVITGEGTAKVSGLYCGQTYTLEEDQSWSWRYEADQSTFTVSHGGSHAEISNEKVENCVCYETVTNTVNNDKWLADDDIQTNRYVK